MKNKRINKMLAATMMAVIFSTPVLTPVHALEDSISNNAVYENTFEITGEELEELNKYFPEDVNFSDEDIEKRLIKAGEFTQEEIDKINEDYDKSISSTSAQARVTYINGYNKYRTFTEKGKQYLYVYVSGKTLQLIKNGASLTASLGGFLPAGIVLRVATVAISTVIGIQMSGINTRYGIVLKFVKDKWVHQGATYTYRYYGWFYQT